MNSPRIDGAGLGLRRELLLPLRDGIPPAIDFFEVSPENWIGLGDRSVRDFRALTERYPFAAHGLALSLGGPAPLDLAHLGRIKTFLDQHRIGLYTEHLSYCGDEGGHLYELLPLPFTGEAVRHVAARIRQVQDFLERRIAVENASYYVAAPGAELDEACFIRAVLEEADCDLHLDLNNIYVNSLNHGYDPYTFLHGLPGGRIVYGHIAGHDGEAPDLIVDTHGRDVIDPVWELLAAAYARFGVFPTLLERDFNLPPLSRLVAEVGRIADLQERQRPRQEWRMAAAGGGR